MGKRKEYQVSLFSLGFIDENLHYGPFSRDWWETRCIKNTTNPPGLYPIRINMKTLVILQNTHFFITVIQGHTVFLQQPGYICEAGDLKSAVFNNPSAAVTTLYQQLFKNGTKFSGPLIMGHDKIEIGEQLLKDVNFRPFCCFNGKFWLFVYGIGISSDEQLYYAGPGFKSSFYYSIGAKKMRTLFVQEIDKKNSIVKMYQDFELKYTYIGNDPNDVWRKVGILQEHRGVDLFGISHPQIQTFIQTLLIPKCLPEEWHIINKMQALWNYHLRKYTLASIQWNEFFNEWYNETKTIIEITTSLKKLYPSNYTFKEREIRAWRAMLSHAGCTNITPYKKDISPVSYFFMNLNESINYNNLLLTSFFLQYEFWTRSDDPSCDRENLHILYTSGFLHPFPGQYHNDGDIFWNCFHQALEANKKGYDGKRRILSIIAEKFSYSVLMEKLKVSITKYVYIKNFKKILE